MSAASYSREIIYDIISNIVKPKEKKKTCYICLEDIEYDEKVFRFCCDKIYHEYCLSQYAHINQYPKCPICRKFIKKDIIDALKIIYREYEIKEARTMMNGAWEFTTNENPHNVRPEETEPLLSPSSREFINFNPFSELVNPLNQALTLHRRRPAISLSARQAMMLHDERHQRRHQLLFEHLRSSENNINHMENMLQDMLDRHQQYFP